MGCAGRPSVGVGQEHEAIGNALVDDPLQILCLVGRFRELRVGVADSQQVVRAEPLGVSIGEVERLVVADLRQRGRVVHHRGPAASAGREVVGQAECVADLVCRELPDPGQDHRRRFGRGVKHRQMLGPWSRPRGACSSGRLASR